MLNHNATTTLYTCRHVFHTICIKKWTGDKLKPDCRCPMCRTQILYYENPTIVTPTPIQKRYLANIIELRSHARVETANVNWANAQIASFQSQLINMREGNKKKDFQKAIRDTQSMIKRYTSYKYREQLVLFEESLALLIRRERLIATHTDAKMLDPDNYNDSDFNEQLDTINSLLENLDRQVDTLTTQIDNLNSGSGKKKQGYATKKKTRKTRK
jgi:DNA-directed RNA polymerase subunit RPC12/RpoP